MPSPSSCESNTTSLAHFDAVGESGIHPIFSAIGVKAATAALTLRSGITYWLGIRHSSTATLSAWASTATPDLNGGAPVTTARKVLRRTLAYATAAPGTWGYLASETTAGPGTAIWMRAA